MQLTNTTSNHRNEPEYTPNQMNTTIKATQNTKKEQMRKDRNWQFHKLLNANENLEYKCLPEIGKKKRTFRAPKQNKKKKG